MASKLRHSDFNLVHRYLCGDKETGHESVCRHLSNA